MIFPAHEPKQATAVLQTVANTCLNLNIPYFLACGTCLGLYRDGIYLLEDGDLDIAAVYTWEGYGRLVSDLFYWGFEADIGTDWEGSHFWKWGFLVDITWIDGEGFYKEHDILRLHDYDYHLPHPIEEYLAWKYGETWRTPMLKGQYVQQHD